MPGAYAEAAADGLMSRTSEMCRHGAERCRRKTVAAMDPDRPPAWRRPRPLPWASTCCATIPSRAGDRPGEWGPFCGLNVLSGACVTDQGVIEGQGVRNCAPQAPAGRRKSVLILADVASSSTGLRAPRWGIGRKPWALLYSSVVGLMVDRFWVWARPAPPPAVILEGDGGGQGAPC